MEVIRFEVEGLFNSFKVPFFRTYHKSLLAPPKTTIIGMLCNIAKKSQKEFFEILEKEKIKVSVVIDSIEGKGKDLWGYKTLESNDIRGKSILQRDKLFKTHYTIYLNINDKNLFEEIFQALKKPKNIPSLGMDDEMVFIKNIKKYIVEKNKNNIINSVFLDKGYEYKVKIKEMAKAIMLPTFHQVPTKYKAFDKKEKFISREPIKEAIFNQVEFLNCEIEFLEEIESYYDEKYNNRIIFY